jgi:hypothetical protein
MEPALTGGLFHSTICRANSPVKSTDLPRLIASAATRSPPPRPDAPKRKIAGRSSILSQGVNLTKLLLNLLDSLDAIRVSFSDVMGRQGYPVPIAWYDRNRE